MGDNAHNFEHRTHVGPAAPDGEHFYHLHFTAASIDVRSPGMALDDGTFAAVLAAAGQGETAWLAAMPSAVSSWLSGRSSAERAGLRALDVKLAAAV